MDCSPSPSSATNLSPRVCPCLTPSSEQLCSISKREASSYSVTYLLRRLSSHLARNYPTLWARSSDRTQDQLLPKERRRRGYARRRARRTNPKGNFAYHLVRHSG